MRISILACLLSAIAAICMYASVAHMLAARHPWFRTVHLIFAALALMAAAHAIAHIAVYNADDVPTYVAASSVSNLSGAIAMVILPWLIQGYFGGGSRIAPTLMSVFYGLSALLNELANVGSSSRPMPTLEQITLPWGELATIHRLPTTPLPLIIFWVVTAGLLAYITMLAVKRRRRGGIRQTIAMVASLTILLLALGANALVLADQLDSIFLGEFGFLALVLTMMRVLSGEESYRAIIAQASAGIFVVGTSGRFLEVNRTGRTMLARTRQELRAMTIEDVIVAPSETQPDGARDDGARHRLQRMRRGDGSILLADMSTQVLADGRALYIARDVTETQRVESAIRLLAESAPQADANVFFSSCARSLAEAFNVRHALIGVIDDRRDSVRVVGRWPVEIAGEDSYSVAGAPIARFPGPRTLYTPRARDEFPSHRPFQMASANGYLGSAILSHDGQLVGIVEVWDDQPFVAGAESHRIIEMFAHRVGAEIERAASDRELRQLTATLEARIATRTAELAQVNAELETFSYSVSHDLRTPVRAIDAYAGLLLEESADRLDASARTHVERMLQAARRMRELIDGLMTLARLSHQPQEVQSVDLSSLAAQAVDMLRDRDRERASHVEFVCAPCVTACADPTGASIILMNLIENAWKYSSRVQQARVEFGCESEAGRTVYFVRDNGVGFEMQHAKHLFEPFRRLHNSSEFPGSGVGLATVARIVKRHNGEIWARSSQGQGATFYFTLPAADASNEAGASSRIAGSA